MTAERWVAGIALCALWPALFFTASPARSATYDPPYPFTADELWEKLTELLAAPNGRVEPARVEQLFGFKFDHLAEKPNNPGFYEVKAHVSWFFDLGVIDPQNRWKQWGFYFNWGQTPGQPYNPFPLAPQAMCIDGRHMLDTADKNGWKLEYDNGLLLKPPPNSYYTKGDATLRVIYVGGCISSLDLMTTNLPHKTSY